MGCCQSWKEGGCSPEPAHKKMMGKYLVQGTMGIPLGAPLPRLKHSGRSFLSAGYMMPLLCAGDWGSIHTFSCPSSLPSILLSLSLHPSCHPSISYTAHPLAQPSGCLHFAYSVPLPLCRSRSCQHPTPRAPHPWENRAGSPLVISIRTPFQQLSTQPITYWLSSPLSSWYVPFSSPFCLVISNFQGLCPGQSCSLSAFL